MRHYPTRQARTVQWSLRLAVLALMIMAAGVGLGWLEKLAPLHALLIAASGAVVAGFALVLAVAAYVDIWRNGAAGFARANLGFALAVLILAAPLWIVARSYALPAIRDISTDLKDPPSFSRSRAALAARADHVPGESSPDVREQQRRAYPEITSIVLELGGEEAYDLVLEAMKELKWHVVDQSPPSIRSGIGRVDAIDRTAVFRFVDDITVRIRPLANETRIDVRSVSRVGKHDLGANAARIRKFADVLNDLSRGS